MRRVVIIGNSLAAAKVATRYKRNDFAVEVNIIVPAEQESGKGPFATAYAQTRANAEFLAMRDLGVVEAHDISIDFDAKTVFPISTRGRISIRYNDLILALDAQPRIPRILRKADNVFAWPSDQGVKIDAMLDYVEEGTADQSSDDAEKRVVIVGQGEAALEALALVAACGQVPVWVRTSDMGPATFDAMLWQKAMAMAEASGVEVYDWSHAPVEKLVTKCDEAGKLQSLALNGYEISGDVFLWTGPCMVQHPVVAEEGVSLDARGRIVVNNDLSTALEGVYMLGTGIAMQSKNGCPMVSRADILGLARSLADNLANGANLDLAGEDGTQNVSPNAQNTSSTATAAMPACLGTMYADSLGFSMSRSGMCLARAAERDVAVEFALVPLGKEFGNGILQLVAGKGAKTMLGYQIVASAETVALLAPALSIAVEQHLSVADFARMTLIGQAGQVLRKAACILDNKLAERIYGVTPEELIASREAGAEFFVLDLRSLPEWKAGHIEGAYNIPFAQLGKRLQDEVPRYTTIVLACNRGSQSWSVASKMRGLGATSLYVLDGGMECWNLDLVEG
ncbi:MAG: FAD-dependent oxidoreductase [Pseudomonadota bacterium]